MTDKLNFPDIGCHCTKCGAEYDTPAQPNCECAGDPPVDHDSLDYEAYLNRVRFLRYDR